jgi:hypothetical protein
MTQVTNITSEALQASIRQLLPSQAGFSEDLQATNLIQPIIDLTPTAEGSRLPESLQQAINKGGATLIFTAGGTNSFTVTPGFYRITGTFTVAGSSGAAQGCFFNIADSTGSQTVYGLQTQIVTAGSPVSESFDFVLFFKSGESLDNVCDTNCRTIASMRQIADVYGNLVNPVGFTFE